MKHVLLLIALYLVSAIAPISAANPVRPFTSLSKERGFEHIMVYNDVETGFSDIRVTLRPDVFLSHFDHAFPEDRGQCYIDLRPRLGSELRGVSVDLGKFKVSEDEFSISLRVPTEHLEKYQLWFSCSIIWEEVPVIGGETFFVSLNELRRADQAILETDPIWAELRSRASTNTTRSAETIKEPESGPGE